MLVEFDTTVLWGAFHNPTGACFKLMALVAQRTPVLDGFITDANELRCEAGPCAGKLKLQVKEAKRGQGRRRSRSVTIGTATYSIAAGKTVTVAVRLERLGVSLLRARHGRLPATVLLESASGQREAKAIQLVKQVPHRRRKTA